MCSVMELIKAKNSPRPANIGEINAEKLSPDEERHLLEIVNGTREFTCSVLSGRGRSLYLPKRKIKGAGGLESTARDGLVFYSPQPDAPFTPAIKHISLTPNLRFSNADARPKAFNSLRLEAAQMEFRAQTRLRVHEIGFDGLCWGNFLDEDGSNEVDLNGYETGFSVTEHDPDYIPLNRILTRYYCEESSLGARKHQDILSDEEVDRHFNFVERVGRLKRKMAVDAELAQHSSTLDNFLYSEEADDLLVTDTDTVADYREMEEFERGSQFLRDSVSDFLKRISELQFVKFSEKVVLITETVAFQFLKGLFGDSVGANEIHATVQELDIPNYVRRRTSGKSSSGILGGISYKDMRPEIFGAIYRLMLKSDFPDNFPIHKIDPKVLYERAETFFLSEN